MTKRTAQEKLVSQLSQNAHGQQPSSFPAKKEHRLSPVHRILRDVLNPHPIRYEGACWPTAVPRK